VGRTERKFLGWMFLRGEEGRERVKPWPIFGLGVGVLGVLVGGWWLVVGGEGLWLLSLWQFGLWWVVIGVGDLQPGFVGIWVVVVVW